MSGTLNLHKEVLDNLYEGVYIIDKDRMITYWNKEAENITGYSSNEIVGNLSNSNILNHIDVHNHALFDDGCPLHHTIEDGIRREDVVFLRHKCGHLLAVTIITLPLFDHGKIIGAAEIFVDDRKKAEIYKTISILKDLALYDPLTELPNRRYIDTVLFTRFEEFEKLGVPFSLAMIDIDHFKKINDAFGHDVGDRVLQMVARTLKGAFRKNDLIGRWGGDEIAAIMTGVSGEDLHGIFEMMRTLVERSICMNGDHQISVTISVGSTLAQTGDTASSILKRADEALFCSKRNGRNVVIML